MLQIPPHWGTFSILIFSFVVFWVVFKWLLFDPFLSLLATRELKFKKLQAQTDELLRQARAAQERREQALIQCRSEASDQREVKRKEAEEKVARLLEEAHLAAKDSIERARDEINQEIRAAEQELDRLAHALAGELAEQVLGRPLGNGGPAINSPN